MAFVLKQSILKILVFLIIVNFFIVTQGLSLHHNRPSNHDFDKEAVTRNRNVRETNSDHIIYLVQPPKRNVRSPVDGVVGIDDVNAIEENSNKDNRDVFEMDEEEVEAQEEEKKSEELPTEVEVSTSTSATEVSSTSALSPDQVSGNITELVKTILSLSGLSENMTMTKVESTTAAIPSLQPVLTQKVITNLTSILSPLIVTETVSSTTQVPTETTTATPVVPSHPSPPTLNQEVLANIASILAPLDVSNAVKSTTRDIPKTSTSVSSTPSPPTLNQEVLANLTSILAPSVIAETVKSTTQDTPPDITTPTPASPSPKDVLENLTSLLTPLGTTESAGINSSSTRMTTEAVVVVANLTTTASQLPLNANDVVKDLTSIIAPLGIAENAETISSTATTTTASPLQATESDKLKNLTSILASLGIVDSASVMSSITSASTEDPSTSSTSVSRQNDFIKNLTSLLGLTENSSTTPATPVTVTTTPTSLSTSTNDILNNSTSSLGLTDTPATATSTTESETEIVLVANGTTPSPLQSSANDLLKNLTSILGLVEDTAHVRSTNPSPKETERSSKHIEFSVAHNQIAPNLTSLLAPLGLSENVHPATTMSPTTTTTTTPIPIPRRSAKEGELFLPDNYNNLIIPKVTCANNETWKWCGTLPVAVYLSIKQIQDLDEEHGFVTLDLDLTIKWIDGFVYESRKNETVKENAKSITLNPVFLNKLWRPDIFLDEMAKVRRTALISKPLKLRFNPATGFITYKTRLTVQLTCEMVYRYYPADTQHCPFTLSSYSYPSSELYLKWDGKGAYLQDPEDPNFDLQVGSTEKTKLGTGNNTYDGLVFTILARRKLSFHMVQTYLPSVFFIVITWLCFLVPSEMVEARIGISMTTLLTLTSMFDSVRENSPLVSYVKAIDIWMVFCIFFIFMTLFEFVSLVWLRFLRRAAENKKSGLEKTMQVMPREKIFGSRVAQALRKTSVAENVKLKKIERASEFTEKYAFIIFSIAFILFNIIYRSCLLISSGYLSWNVNAVLNADLDED